MTGWTAYLHDIGNVAFQAKADLQHAYDDAAGRTATTTFTATDNQLGGQTLKSGVYAFGHADTANLTAASPLILDAEGNEEAVFIFQASSDLVIASGSTITLINGAKFCRVFWQVTSSATLGSGSYFVGHIFASTSIWAKTGARVQGQLLALTGEVTLEANTITNGLCAVESTPSATATLTPTTTPTPTTTETTTSTGTTTTSTGTTTTSTDTTTTSTDTTTTSTDTTTTSTTDQELPKTGESGPSVIIGFGLLSLAGALALILRRKGSR